MLFRHVKFPIITSLLAAGFREKDNSAPTPSPPSWLLGRWWGRVTPELDYKAHCLGEGDPGRCSLEGMLYTRHCSCGHWKRTLFLLVDLPRTQMQVYACFCHHFVLLVFSFLCFLSGRKELQTQVERVSSICHNSVFISFLSSS